MTRKTGQNQSMAKSQYPQKCAKNPTQKNCAKNPTQKKTGLTGNPKVKYFRNAKVKYFRNAKVKCQGQISQGQMGNHKKPEKTGFNWKK